jgi:hypothetical protein
LYRQVKAIKTLYKLTILSILDSLYRQKFGGQKVNSIKKYISNSFSITFPRQERIRRQANSFEDKLKERYPTIQILPIPDNLDPKIPRIVFESEHGFSQIAISEIAISLNVSYSNEFQEDISKGASYLKERISLIFDLLNIAQVNSPYFSGIITQLQIVSDKSDEEIIAKIAESFQLKASVAELYDLEIKVANKVEDRFFSNIKVKNFRAWNFNNPIDNPKLKKKEANLKGIEITGDYNDRYSHNEIDNYITNELAAHEVLAKGIKAIEQFSKKLI